MHALPLPLRTYTVPNPPLDRKRGKGNSAMAHALLGWTFLARPLFPPMLLDILRQKNIQKASHALVIPKAPVRGFAKQRSTLDLTSTSLRSIHVGETQIREVIFGTTVVCGPPTLSIQLAPSMIPGSLTRVFDGKDNALDHNIPKCICTS